MWPSASAHLSGGTVRPVWEGSRGGLDAFATILLLRACRSGPEHGRCLFVFEHQARESQLGARRGVRGNDGPTRAPRWTHWWRTTPWGPNVRGVHRCSAEDSHTDGPNDRRPRVVEGRRSQVHARTSAAHRPRRAIKRAPFLTVTFRTSQGSDDGEQSACSDRLKGQRSLPVRGQQSTNASSLTAKASCGRPQLRLL